jgi:hypothetical protein
MDYRYFDEDGDPVHRVVKRELQSGKKTYHQEHWDGSTWVKGSVPNADTLPYNLPDVLDAIERGEDAIWVTEGEKDADSGKEAYGLVTTTNPGGAGKWRDHHSRFLRGAERVFIVWDKDDKGAEHAWTVHDSLRKHGVPDIYFRSALEGNDLTDHINAGHQKRDLVRTKPPRPKKAEKKVADDEPTGEYLPSSFQLALLKLQELGTVALESADDHQYNAICPAHDDTDPSLTIRPGRAGDTVKVLVHCFAGCTPDAIAKALGVDPKEFTEIEQEQETRIDVLAEREYERIMARRKADMKVWQEAATTSRVIKLTGTTENAADELKIPLEPEKWMVQDWFKYNSINTLIADAKAGKTRLCLNLVQALTEDKPFLGIYQTFMPEDAKALYFNYDMSENLFREYMAAQQWQRPERWVVKHVGALGFPFWRDEVYADFVQYALDSHIYLWVIDTLQVAGQGFISDENNNTEMASFYGLLKIMAKEAGIPHVLITHHRGRAKDEHGRGASSLDGATDSWWMLSQEDRNEFDSPRSLSARGRDVGHRPVELEYNEATGLISSSGKTPTPSTQNGAVKVTFDRSAVRFATFCRNLKAFFDENGRWPSATVAQRKLMPGDNNASREMLAEAVRLGYVSLVSGSGKANLVQLTEKGLGAVNADL